MKSGQYVGKSRAGDIIGEGKVAERSGRWWSWDYWFGHWDERNDVGEYRPEGSGRRWDSGSGRQPAPLWMKSEGLPEGLRRRRPVEGRRQSTRQREASEYRAYLEAQYDAAESATRGTMLNRAGKARGVNPRSAWFAGRNGSTTYASEELRGYFSRHGRPLTNEQWRAQGSASAMARSTRGPVRLTVRKRAA